MLRAFEAGADIHSATAAEVCGTDGEVSADDRRSAKAINFGLIYGMSAFGLARQLGIERAQAQNYVDLYFARYPGVKDYMDAIRAEAHERGYVETVFGGVFIYLRSIRATPSADSMRSAGHQCADAGFSSRHNQARMLFSDS